MLCPHLGVLDTAGRFFLTTGGRVLCRERLGTGAFHTRDGFNVAFRHGLQFDTGPRNHGTSSVHQWSAANYPRFVQLMTQFCIDTAVVSAALKALLNSVFRNPPMLALFHEMEGETRLAAAISSKGFGESPLSLQRQVLQLTYVILAMHEPSLGVFRRGGGIHTLADGLSQHLQPFAHDGERDEEIPDDVAAVLAEVNFVFDFAFPAASVRSCVAFRPCGRTLTQMGCWL